jgi:hypothetical protein
MRHLERFVTAYADWIRRNPAPDAIVAPANSGTVMIEIARIVHDVVRIPLPPVLILPIFTTYWFPGVTSLPYDNAALIPVAHTFFSEHASRNALFLDDEIGNGQSFRAVMSIVAAASPQSPNRTCTIIAEGNNLTWAYPFDGFRTMFLPYALRPRPDMSGILCNELIDDATVHLIGAALGRTVMKKEAACLLLDQPIKCLNKSIPEWDTESITYCVKGIPHFRERQKRFRQELAEAVSGTVAETFRS